MTNMELTANNPAPAPAAPDPAVKQTAIDLWTAFREAMVKDGMLGALITRTGEATGNMLLDLARTLNTNHSAMQPQEMPLLPMNHPPAPGVEVVLESNEGQFSIGVFDEAHQAWRIARSKTKLVASRFKGWRFVVLPK